MRLMQRSDLVLNCAVHVVKRQAQQSVVVCGHDAQSVTVSAVRLALAGWARVLCLRFVRRYRRVEICRWDVTLR